MKTAKYLLILLLFPISAHAKFMTPKELGLEFAPLTYYLNTTSITTLEKSFTIGNCVIVYSDGEKSNHSYHSKYTCDELVKIIERVNNEK